MVDAETGEAEMAPEREPIDSRSWLPDRFRCRLLDFLPMLDAVGRVMVSVPGSGSHLLGRVIMTAPNTFPYPAPKCISRKTRAETNRAAASTRGISTASARAGCVPRNSRDAPFQNHIPKAASNPQVVRGAVGNNGPLIKKSSVFAASTLHWRLSYRDDGDSGSVRRNPQGGLACSR